MVVCLGGCHLGKHNKHQVFSDSNYFSFAYSRTTANGLWTHYSTGLEVDINIGKNKVNDPGHCGVMMIKQPGWRNFYCKTKGIPQITCACDHPGQMYLHLRGLCPDSNIDKYFVPRNKQKSGALVLVGVAKQSMIEYVHIQRKTKLYIKFRSG